MGKRDNGLRDRSAASRLPTVTIPFADNSAASAIERLTRGERLGEELTTRAFRQLMNGEATPVQISALLVGLRVQGETGEEVAGAVRAMRDAMVRVSPGDRSHLIDTCGTGGGTVPTFNVSTAAAVIAVAAGATVAKHGNRSFTSKCGSADVLEVLGVELSIEPARAASLLDTTGMVFLFAQVFHPAMRHVAPVRKELGVPTIMNLLGPLSNPAGVQRQVVGVADPRWAPLVAEALRRLGVTHALVVHGEVGMDEIAPRGRTAVWEIRDGRVETWGLEPRTYGLEVDDLGTLVGGEPRQNADRIRRLFERPGADRAGRAAVLLNAAAGLYVAGIANDFADGVARAEEALERGGAREALERFIAAAGKVGAGTT